MGGGGGGRERGARARSLHRPGDGCTSPSHSSHSLPSTSEMSLRISSFLGSKPSARMATCAGVGGWGELFVWLFVLGSERASWRVERRRQRSVAAELQPATLMTRHAARAHLELLGVDAPRAVRVEEVERVAQLGALLVRERCAFLCFGRGGVFRSRFERTTTRELSASPPASLSCVRVRRHARAARASAPISSIGGRDSTTHRASCRASRATCGARLLLMGLPPPPPPRSPSLSSPSPTPFFAN